MGEKSVKFSPILGESCGKSFPKQEGGTPYPPGRAAPEPNIPISWKKEIEIKKSQY
jgi:hypothetical protein